MKKISTCLLALLLLVAAISVTQAAGLNELTETKVQLEDSLDADGFAAAYNKISAYPIAGDLTKRVQGNYISYFALTNDTLLAARLPREETQRTWTFLKAVNPEKQVTTILIEAVVDQNP